MEIISYNVGLLETYILVCVFLNISIIIAVSNSVQTTLGSTIPPLYFDLFSKTFLPKNDV